MRIAHVTATFPPYLAGTGNVAYHNARLMHDRGHDVTVFTAARGQDGALQFPFPVRRLPALLRLGNASFTPGLIGGLADVDIIHLHYPYIFGAELTLAASKIHGIPFVLTYHNRLHEEHRVKGALFAAYNLLTEPLILRSVARIIAVQRNHILSVHPHLAGDERLLAIPNGVDTTLFRPGDRAAARARLGLSRDGPVVVFVGVLDQAHRFKNVEGLLAAFAHADVPTACLLIAGDGDLRPMLERRTERLGILSQVRFLGALEPAELPDVYRAADVTVLSSSSVESFGMVLIESMACGTPVVAPDLPGVRDIVGPGVDGFHFPAGNDRELGALLRNLLTDRGALERMGGPARRKAVRQYAWPAIAADLEAAYVGAAGAREALA